MQRDSSGVISSGCLLSVVAISGLVHRPQGPSLRPTPVQIRRRSQGHIAIAGRAHTTDASQRDSGHTYMTGVASSALHGSMREHNKRPI
jgi:hypothetical protein